MRYLLLLPLLVGCASGPIKRVDFTKDVDLTKNGEVGCLYVKSQSRLICMSPSEFTDLRFEIDRLKNVPK